MTGTNDRTFGDDARHTSAFDEESFVGHAATLRFAQDARA